MARRASEKERGRAQRLAAERAAAKQAQRQGALKIVAAGVVGLIAIAAVTFAIVSSRSGQDTVGRASAPQPTPPAQVSGLSRPIAANVREANRVIDTPIQTKLAALRGVPVVVNQWASWCPNCKAEFPFFQQLARRYQRQVAFLGLDSQDTRGNAEEFLRQFPVQYPSIFDQDASQAASVGGGQAWPTTFFYDRTGRQTFVRPGGYATLQSLDIDIRRYALRG